MRHPMSALVIGLVLLTSHVSPLTSQGRAFTPNDWYRVTTVSTPAVSPDGKQIAFTVTTVVAAENKRHSEVWLVPAAGGEPTRMTSPGVESTNPSAVLDGDIDQFIEAALAERIHAEERPA